MLAGAARIKNPTHHMKKFIAVAFTLFIALLLLPPTQAQQRGGGGGGRGGGRQAGMDGDAERSGRADRGERQAPEAPEGVKTIRDLAYVSGGDARQKLDLYLPKSDGPLPLVIWVHGGGWRQGTKGGNLPALRLTRLGYAVASIDYRLSGDAKFPAQIEDCKAAVRWLRAHAKKYNLDPDRFGAWGSSAGGHLVAFLGTSGSVKEFEVGENLKVSSGVQAVCDWFGPTDLLQMDAHAPANSVWKHDAPDSPEGLLIGGPIQENQDKAARANPIIYITPDDPPFLIMHGDQDPAVPIHQSELLSTALQKAGVPVKFQTIKGAGHGGRGFMQPDVSAMVDAFFDARLKSQKP